MKNMKIHEGGIYHSGAYGLKTHKFNDIQLFYTENNKFTPISCPILYQIGVSEFVQNVTMVKMAITEQSLKFIQIYPQDKGSKDGPFDPTPFSQADCKERKYTFIWKKQELKLEQ